MKIWGLPDGQQSLQRKEVYPRILLDRKKKGVCANECRGLKSRSKSKSIAPGLSFLDILGRISEVFVSCACKEKIGTVVGWLWLTNSGDQFNMK